MTMVLLCLLPGGNGSVLVLSSPYALRVSLQSLFWVFRLFPLALTRDSKLGFSKDRRGIWMSWELRQEWMCCLFHLVPIAISNKYRESRKIQPILFFLFLSRSLQIVSFQIKADPPPTIADTGLWKQLGLLVTYAAMAVSTLLWRSHRSCRSKTPTIWLVLKILIFWSLFCSRLSRNSSFMGCA